MKIEDARKDDAPQLAQLINLAGEGIPEYLWSGLAEGEDTPLDVGSRRAAREEGGFSYRNARVIRQDGQVAGMLVAYQLDDPYRIGEPSDYPAVVFPLIQLEAQAPGSWYINAVATRQACQGQGLGKQLMEEAERQAREQGITTLSLIVASENETARDLYLKLDYTVKDSRPVLAYPGARHGGNWELMVKTLA